MKEIRIMTESMSISCMLRKDTKCHNAFILDPNIKAPIGHIDFSKQKLKFEFNLAGTNIYSIK